MSRRQPSALFLFKAGRRDRLAGTDIFPTEFFYGYCELRKTGFAVDLLDERDIEGNRPQTAAGRLFRRIFFRLLPDFPVFLPYAFVIAWNALGRLNRVDVVVATTQTFGLCLALLRRLGLLKARVAFLAMGALPLSLPRAYRPVVTWLLRACDILAISKGDRDYLAEQLGPKATLHYVPFGVDAAFWMPDPTEKTAFPPFALAIGNDRHRDFQLLVDIWRPDFPKLVIVTGLRLRCDKANVEVRAGDWRRQLFSDAEIRQLYRQSLFVVLPLVQTIQPAGQSACLQAMACGKGVILSDIQGLWDRDSLRDSDTCLLVPPGSGEALAKAVARCLADSMLPERLGMAGRREIEHGQNTKAMARAMAAVLGLGEPLARLAEES